MACLLAACSVLGDLLDPGHVGLAHREQSSDAALVQGRIVELGR